MKKDLYRKFCDDPSARQDEGYTRKCSHFFCGVENSSKDTVSTITATQSDEVVARVSTWAGAIEVVAAYNAANGTTGFQVSMVPHAGNGDTIRCFSSGVFGDGDTVQFNPYSIIYSEENCP